MINGPGKYTVKTRNLGVTICSPPAGGDEGARRTALHPMSVRARAIFVPSGKNMPNEVVGFFRDLAQHFRRPYRQPSWGVPSPSAAVIRLLKILNQCRAPCRVGDDEYLPVLNGRLRRHRRTYGARGLPGRNQLKVVPPTAKAPPEAFLAQGKEEATGLVEGLPAIGPGHGGLGNRTLTLLEHNPGLRRCAADSTSPLPAPSGE
jgi:hypothetical protein